MTIELAPGRRGGLELRHPVLVAAGGAGFGSELLDAVADQTPGAIITRSVTREARAGNPPPRMTSLPDGLLSSVGLQNPGVDAVLRRQGPRWAGSDVPIIVSICADNAEDIARLARLLDMQPDISGLELNLACPDRGRSGEPIGLDIEASEMATVAARAATDLPLVVKLTGSAPDIRSVARAVAAAGADAISAIAPLPALSIDDQRQGPSLGTAYGGLSGPALKPIALRVVFEVAQVVRIPIIGCGGISSLDDVLDYLAAGATAVGLATAALADPWLPGRLGSELAARQRAQGVTGYRDLVGTALPRHKDRGSLRRGPFRP
jgi:dihydroorotate dehydrogenase (NAD+) catalytic subunit